MFRGKTQGSLFSVLCILSMSILAMFYLCKIFYRFAFAKFNGLSSMGIGQHFIRVTENVRMFSTRN